MNPSTLREAKEIFGGIKKSALKLKKTQIVVCAPFVYLSELKRMFKGKQLALGGQDCFAEEKGEWTGAVSVTMLKSVGADFVLTGHSERRALGESDELINQKIKLALKRKLTIVLCVGENSRDEEGKYFAFLERQILAGLQGVNKTFLKKILIAYEPLWAIGKNARKIIAVAELEQVSIFIRKILADKYGVANFNQIEILYGGSVDDKNAEELLRGGGIAGFLVGRAGLDAEKFGRILKIAERGEKL